MKLDRLYGVSLGGGSGGGCRRRRSSCKYGRPGYRQTVSTFRAGLRWYRSTPSRGHIQIIEVGKFICI